MSFRKLRIPLKIKEEPVEEMYANRISPNRSSHIDQPGVGIVSNKSGNIHSVKQKSNKVNSPEFQAPTKVPCSIAIAFETSKVLNCDFCPTTFFSQDSLEEHIIDIHVVDKEFNCPKCCKSLLDIETLDLHVLEHEKELKTSSLKQCKICGRPNNKNLGKHMKTHDAVGDRLHKCKLCPKSYILPSELETHEMYNHGREKKFKCHKCPKSYVEKKFLLLHLRTHMRNFVCGICDAVFGWKSGWKAHRKVCSLANARRKEIQGNLAELPKTFEVEGKKRRNSSKGFKCDICGKVVTRKASLKAHLARRHGVSLVDPEYKCSFCSNEFKRKQDLNGHIRKEHRESPLFNCPECSEMFFGEASVEEHIVHCHSEVNIVEY